MSIKKMSSLRLAGRVLTRAAGISAARPLPTLKLAQPGE